MIVINQQLLSFPKSLFAGKQKFLRAIGSTIGVVGTTSQEDLDFPLPSMFKSASAWW
jgi:hypothetical protein